MHVLCLRPAVPYIIVIDRVVAVLYIIDRVVSLFDHCTYAIKTDGLSEYVSRICTALVSMPKKRCVTYFYTIG